MKKVFLSSVSRDLEECRAKVEKAINSLDGFRCINMENFGARDYETDDYCTKLVTECDVFVGITGHIYGSIHEPSGQSFTEREYDVAVNCKKPRLMFLASEEYPIHKKWLEKDEIRAKQDKLRERVS
ncbi:DUF4062 domain-containing protein, partial [bacterium]|nr:DUF4062 domain-containing protein [bacterium]